MPRAALTTVILMSLATLAHAQTSDSLIPERLCYHLRYATPEYEARASAFPRSVVLAPGRDSGDATPETTFVDSVQFGHMWPLRAYWRERKDSIEVVFSNGFSSSVVQLPRTLRDSMEGRSVYLSDWRPLHPPRMRAFITRHPCTP